MVPGIILQDFVVDRRALLGHACVARARARRGGCATTTKPTSHTQTKTNSFNQDAPAKANAVDTQKHSRLRSVQRDKQTQTHANSLIQNAPPEAKPVDTQKH